MRTLYIRTDDSGPQAVCRGEDEPPPQGDNARWRLVTRTEDPDEAGWLVELLQAELAARSTPAQLR